GGQLSGGPAAKEPHLRDAARGSGRSRLRPGRRGLQVSIDSPPKNGDLARIMREGGNKAATESLKCARKAVLGRLLTRRRGGSMATACIAQSTLQVHGISKPIVARFDQPQASSDGGALLLKLADDQLGLTWRLASALRDRRQPGKVAHPLRDLLRQRVFGLACGYADCNDAARLVDDPIHKLVLERDPLDGAPLGSQPTLSRFENAVGRADLYRLGTALADTVLSYHRARLGAGVRLITIDLDATDDPTHGQQEFALFNGYYDTWCYLPLVATVTFDTEPLQHVVAALLRPGT